ncbi:hypothetical protein UFOVP244_133 [uncultured Caudovirales phage]|uniref:Uncharacterized protein n=1 Tax=uncultured Caudovirales phage TaxID=2100421 RepID=A0A6J7X1Z6_9CAUD|nr:hypothetical protein UFOVP244_133 [uncultured Caudovirales phage]
MDNVISLFDWAKKSESKKTKNTDDSQLSDIMKKNKEKAERAAKERADNNKKTLASQRLKKNA